MAEGGAEYPDEAVPASPGPPRQVTVELFDSALWSSLADQCNEMEVSGSVRKLVPELIIKVSGLVDDLEYTLSVMFVPTDDDYYLYQDDAWTPGGVFPEEHPATVYWHPNGKMTGREWSSHFIKFPDLRLTTDPNAVPPKMFVDERRYYQTVIVFTGRDGTSVLKLPELRFMAVLWIHNPHVKELKDRGSEEPPPKTRRVSRRTSDGESSSRTPSQRTQPQEGQRPSGKSNPTPTPQNDSEAPGVSSPMLALSGRQPGGTSCMLPPYFVRTAREVHRDLTPSTSAHAVTSFTQPPTPVMGPSDLSRDPRPRMATLSSYGRTSCIQPLPPVTASSEVYRDLGPQTAPFSAHDRTSCIQPSSGLASSDQSRDPDPLTDPFSAHARTSCTMPPRRVSGGPPHDLEPLMDPFFALARTSCIRPASSALAFSNVSREREPQMGPFPAHTRTSSILPPFPDLISRDVFHDFGPQTDPFAAHARTSCRMPPPRVSSDLPRDLESLTDPFAALARTSCIRPTPSAVALSNVSRDPDPRTDPFPAHTRTSCTLPPFPALISRDVFRDPGPQTGPLAAHARTSCTMPPPSVSSDLTRDLGPLVEPFSVQPTAFTSYPGYVTEYEKFVIVSSTTDSTEHAPQLPSFGLEYAAVEETHSWVDVPVELTASRGPTSEESQSQSAAASAHDGEPSHAFLARPSQAFVQHPGALDLVVSALSDEEDYVPETDRNKEP